MFEHPVLPPFHTPPHLTLVNPGASRVIETTARPLTLTVIDDDTGLEALREDWEQLWVRSDRDAFPLQFAWTMEWWRHFRTPRRTLFIVTVRMDGELIAVLPLYREASRGRRQRLFFISQSSESSHSFYPEYTDVLSLPSAVEIVKATLTGFLRSSSVFHSFDCGLCRTPGILESTIVPDLKTRWHTTTRTPLVAPRANLREGFQRYLDQLSAQTRQQFKRLLRSFHGTAGATFEIARDSAERDTFLLELISLHQARWREVGESGAFSTPQRIAFHRGLIAALGASAVLSRISLHGEPLAAVYGFMCGKTFQFYQSGNAPKSDSLKRTGILAHLLTMSALAERGVETYDFLEGRTPYKMQLSTDLRPLTAISLEPISIISVARRGRRWIKSLLGNHTRQTQSLPEITGCAEP
jgi:CelD/BcsL family acetyltransferase involved in cellulose biosynthesis